MTWNPSDYSGVKQIALSSYDVWRPNLILQYSKSDENKLLNKKHPILVNNFGSITWWTKKILTTRCPMDLTEFPFDIQNCYIIIVSIDPKHHVNFTVGTKFNQTELWSYTSGINPKWIFKNKKSDIKMVGINHNEYPFLRLKATFQRNNTFYFYIISIPYFVSIILSILQFIISPNCQMRYSIGSIAVFIHIILLIYLSSILKLKTYFVPKLIKRLSLNVISIVLVMCSSIFMTNFLIKFSQFEFYIIINNFLQGNLFGKLICFGYVYSNESSEKQKDQLINILIDRITFIIFLIYTLITHL